MIPTIFKDKQVVAALLTMLVSIIVFVLATYVKTYLNSEGAVIPHLMWTYGNTPESVLGGILSNPSMVFKLFITGWTDKLTYLLYLFGPVAFLAILDPLTLVLSAPWLLISFISSGNQYYSIVFQYSGFVAPFVFISAIYGFRRVLNMGMIRGLHLMKMLLMLIMATSIIFAFAISPIGINMSIPTLNAHDELLNKIISYIPSEASLLTQNDLFPHVSKNLNAFLYPTSSQYSFDYVLFDTTSWWFTQHDPVFNMTPSGSELLPGMLESGNYGVYASADGILLLKRGYLEEAKLLVPAIATFNLVNLTVPTGDPFIQEQIDSTSASGNVLLHRKGGNLSSPFWFGPYKAFPPGLYEVTFRLKTTAIDFGYIATLDVAANEGHQVLSSRRLYGHDFPKTDDWNNISMLFLNKKPQLLEFRGLDVSNSTDLYLDFIELKQTSWDLKEIHLTSYFDFQELTLARGAIERNLLVHSSNDSSGWFWYGPYTTLQPGSYQTTFWLKTSATSPELKMSIDVTMKGNHILSSQDITGSEFSTEHRWQPFTLSFQLDETTSGIEFRGTVHNAKFAIMLSNIELQTLSN
jgi:hypothetical protein